MKIFDKDFIAGRAKAMSAAVVEKKLAEYKKAAELRKKNASKIYLDEYGNEVHINGPVVETVHKVETLQERIARYDRLAAAVRASRQAMNFVANEMGVIGVDKHGQPIFGKDVVEDPEDFEKLSDVEEIDDFGDVIEKPAIGVQDGEKIAAPQSQAIEEPIEKPVADPVPEQE